MLEAQLWRPGPSRGRLPAVDGEDDAAGKCQRQVPRRRARIDSRMAARATFGWCAGHRDAREAQDKTGCWGGSRRAEIGAMSAWRLKWSACGIAALVESLRVLRGRRRTRTHGPLRGVRGMSEQRRPSPSRRASASSAASSSACGCPSSSRRTSPHRGSDAGRRPRRLAVHASMPHRIVLPRHEAGAGVKHFQIRAESKGVGNAGESSHELRLLCW